MTRAHARRCRTMHVQSIRRTGNKALSTIICAACAMTHLKVMLLRDILNGARLLPSHPHPAHVLSSGMLLRKSAIWNIERVIICLGCERALSQNKTLPLYLARNNMWIGEIPWVPEISCKEGQSCNGMIWDNRPPDGCKRSECQA